MHIELYSCHIISSFSRFRNIGNGLVCKSAGWLSLRSLWLSNSNIFRSFALHDRLGIDAISSEPHADVLHLQFGARLRSVFYPQFLLSRNWTIFSRKVVHGYWYCIIGCKLGCSLHRTIASSTFGWRGTLRIMSTSFALVCLLSLAFNPNLEAVAPVKTMANNGNKVEKRKGIYLYCSAWTFPTFSAIVISQMFGYFGLYIPYINLVSPIFLPV